MEFSPEQKRVIDTEGKNILVSAAAGSGKTAVLVERIIRKICGGVDGLHKLSVDSLLVMTFTRAAAGEMKERIEAAIVKALDEALADGSDKELIDHLKQQSILIKKASITTIDGFCGEIIRNNFAAIGLDPAYRVAEEAELALLRADCMNEVLEEAYDEGSEELLEFLERFSTKKSDNDVMEAIETLYDYSMSKPDPYKWLVDITSNYNLDSAEKLFELGIIKDYIVSLKDEIKGMAAESLADVRICELPSGPYAYAQILEKEAEDFIRIAKAEDLTSLDQLIKSYSFERLPSIKKADAVDEALKKLVADNRKDRKARLGKMITPAMGSDKELLYSDICDCAIVVRILSELTIKFADRFSELKREKQVLDFADMEHLALLILYDQETGRPSEVAKGYREKFSEIMVDEYQDSNEAQEAITGAICRPNNVFTVGDVKQSIYRFRLSDPSLFMKKMNDYSKEESVENDIRIDLHNNFRSSSYVLDSTNYVFEKIMHTQVGGVEYDEDAALVHGRLNPDAENANTELLLISPSEEIDNKELEAICVAQKIEQLMKDFKYPSKDGKEECSCKYSDIVILLRSRSGWEDVFSKVLSSFSIPVHCESQTGYFTSYEIRNLISYLTVINNPLNDEALAAAMLGPFGLFDEAELSRLRINGEGRCFYEAVNDFLNKNEDASEDENELLEKVQAFYKKIYSYRKMSAYTSVGILIEKIIDDFHYDLIVSAMDKGDVREANLSAFLVRASDYEKTSFKGLHDFLRYIERIKSYDYDFGDTELASENDNCVRIMSIHKSKGLEFPVTFLCGTSKAYNEMDLRASFVLDADEGIGMDHIDPVNRVKAPTILKKALQLKQKSDLYGEELRILYVAMTRAREKLIMTGAIDDKSLINYEAADDNFSQSRLLKCNSYLKLLLSAAYNRADCPIDIIRVEAEDILAHEGREILESGSSGIISKLFKGCNTNTMHQVYIKPTDDLVLSDDEQVYINHLENLELSDDAQVYIKQLKSDYKYNYPHKSGISVPMKLSVSAIKKAAIEEDGSLHVFDAKGEADDSKSDAPVPAFISGERKEALIGALRGTAYHRYFELMDFDGESRCLNDSYVNRGLISLAQFNAVATEDVEKFTKTSLYKRMSDANARGELYKEQPFSYLVNASEVDINYPKDESIVVQGIIDAFFYENDEIVIMDYKTDKVYKGERLVELYKKQLELYAGALTQITGKKVKECIIYSVTLGEEIAVL